MMYFNLETLPVVYKTSENYITIIKNKTKKTFFVLWFSR